jgi:hypothetical protein
MQFAQEAVICVIFIAFCALVMQWSFQVACQSVLQVAACGDFQRCLEL